MKGRKGACCRLILWFLVLLLAMPPGVLMAQGQVPGSETFRQEELDQMLAPIALYPDELLVQILIAATYPLEVVQAARWVKANPNLKGDQLAAELEQQDWDPSVKSLVNFPSVLAMMNDRLEWMQALGDAFLAQERQVMETVQHLRQRARAHGNLTNTSEQKVILDPGSQEIIIEPAVSHVIYVPVYDPMIVYGPWWWPAYRPFYYYPAGPALRGGLVCFGLGVAIGVPWGYAWGGFNWRHQGVVFDVSRNVRINNRIDRSRYAGHAAARGGHGAWRHDPVHRQGVGYRVPSVAQQYGRGTRPGVDATRDFTRPERGGTAGRRSPGHIVVQQNRVAPGPVQAGREPQMQLPRRPRSEPAPQVKVELPGQRAVPVQPRVMPAPSPARPEPPRQPVTPAPRATSVPSLTGTAPLGQPASPARPATNGIQGRTTFGGSGPGNQTRHFSYRGHDSHGGARTVGQASTRTHPGGGSTGRTAPQRVGGRGNAQNRH